MEKTVKRGLYLLLVLAILLSLAVPVYAADSTGAPFRYRHDPRLNPRAMEDIVVDPNAVYGFAPSPTGSLAAYAEMDWTDPELVNGEKGRLARIAYHESIRELYDLLDELTAEGKSAEEIARVVSPKRNEIRLAAYENDPEGLETAKARNLEKYGHEEGPLPEELYEQYGSWEIVIEKAFSVNSGMDACLGLYDDYFEVYVAAGQLSGESEMAASREYAAAAFADAAGITAEDPDAGVLEAYSDAAEIHEWFRTELEGAVSSGILRGYPDGTLHPLGTIRRVEAMALLSRCLPELKANREAIAFSDVPAWAQDDIDRLSAAGLVEGYGNDLLGADDPMTVEQVGILLDRCRVLTSAELPEEEKP